MRVEPFRPCSPSLESDPYHVKTSRHQIHIPHPTVSEFSSVAYIFQKECMTEHIIMKLESSNSAILLDR